MIDRKEENELLPVLIKFEEVYVFRSLWATLVEFADVHEADEPVLFAAVGLCYE